MPYHEWGDEDFDWDALNDCVGMVYKLKNRYRLGGSAKEKFGTLRWYSPFQYISLHALIYPGYVYNRFPDWLWKLDCQYFGPVLRAVFGRLWGWYQVKAYNWVYQHLLKKHPHIRAEILESADHLELIKGATRVDGNKTHVIGWNGEILATWTRMGNDQK